jgi:hypothetical protein
LSWEQVVTSLQTLLGKSPRVLGGPTALALEGFEHHIPAEDATVHLYCPESPPGWLQKLKLSQRFVFHNSRRLVEEEVATGAEGVESEESGTGATNGLQELSLKTLPWGQWGWPLTISRRERAILELLDELPNRESFHQADVIMQGAATLSPKRLQVLLDKCLSVKVKRLFFFFADRHRHACLRYVNKDTVDLGSGKHVLVRGGCLHPKYRITVPAELVPTASDRLA